jgi:hypothetical protein
MTCSAPMELTRSTWGVLHTPVTSAPNALASCTASNPTPPDVRKLLRWGKRAREPPHRAAAPRM